MKRTRDLITTRTVAVLAVVAAAVASVSCSSSTPRAELEPYECGNVARIHTLDGVFLASQPQQDDFKHAKEGGIKTVVNLRRAGELDWDEAAFVKGLDMEYHNVPFRGPAELTDEVFDSVRELLMDDAKKPLLLHCSSANRVGAIWLAHRVLDHGLSLEAAQREAETVGLKLPAYADRAKEYIKAKRS